MPGPSFIPTPFQSVSVAQVASVDATEIIASRQIESELSPCLQNVGLIPGVIEEMSGVIERRFWPVGTAPSDAAFKAATKALDSARVPTSDIGLLINASVSRDFVEPSTACIVHSKLGLSASCISFDLSNACLGFLNAMDIAARYIESGAVKRALITCGESCRYTVERTIEKLNASPSHAALMNNFATLTLGSGAVAMLMERTSDQSQAQYFGGLTLSNTKEHTLCQGTLEGMITDGTKLLHAGLTLAKQTFEAVRLSLGWNVDFFDQFAIHQVSTMHTRALMDALSISKEQVTSLFPYYGNTGPASIPMVLARLQEQGKLVSGKRVGLLGIGSGLNCTMSEMVW